MSVIWNAVTKYRVSCNMRKLISPAMTLVPTTLSHMAQQPTQGEKP